jgi:hypothetical protein
MTAIRAVQTANCSLIGLDFAASDHVPDHLGLHLLDFQQVRPLLMDRQVELLVKSANLQFGLQIDLVIVFGAQAIPRLLAVLAHQDDRRLQQPTSDRRVKD